MVFNQIVVFDWDDTLCCSTFLHSHNYGIESKRPFTEPLAQALAQLDEIAFQVLNDAVDLAGLKNVYIVTNAEAGWVEVSAQLFLPKTRELLKNKKLKVLSARTLYESQNPSQPVQWKVNCFSYLVAQNFGKPRKLTIDDESSGESREEKSSSEKGSRISWVKSPLGERNTNAFNTVLNQRSCVCSIGDSQAERLACLTSVKDRPDTITKTIKFMERPTCEELVFQLMLLKQNLPVILNHKEDLDHMLLLTRQYSPRC